MKNAIVIALALVTVSAMAAGKPTKEQKQAAKEACTAEGKTKKDMKACVKAKLAAPAAEAKMEAPATEAPAAK
ncbi:MAG: hypothetical protein WC635_02675 [Bacteriovorax sp.]|jgi:hypothetical protein